ncbi:hypothetical protein [Halostella salina]|uniref:hypothetical protein n=1 Tax=Halostella salina TaxID=1547897 RepID=UPI000EF7B6E6|nr:hypothetical protein [Halostella salina]
MQRQLLTVAVAALLAFGAGGVAAAAPTSPQPAPGDGSAADVAQPSNHTVEVVDPDDELSDRDVERAWRTAWDHDAVRDHFDGGPVHFHVEAVDGDLEVYVAPDEGAPPEVVADVALDDGTVTEVEELNNVRTASESETKQLPAVDLLDGETTTLTLGNVSTVEVEEVDRSVTLTPVEATDELDVSVTNGTVDEVFTVNATEA